MRKQNRGLERQAVVIGRKICGKGSQKLQRHLSFTGAVPTFCTEQTNNGASSCQADGGQGITWVRSQEPKERPNSEVLWCLQDKGGTCVMGWLDPTAGLSPFFSLCRPFRMNLNPEHLKGTWFYGWWKTPERAGTVATVLAQLWRWEVSPRALPYPSIWDLRSTRRESQTSPQLTSNALSPERSTCLNVIR